MNRPSKATRPFLSPLNDYAFKKIFADEDHKDRVIDMLSAFLDDQLATPIRDVTFLDPDPTVEVHRPSLIDLHCKDSYGVEYIIELQVAHHKYFIDPAQRYAVRAYIDRMGKGGLYEGVKEVIYLAITDHFILFPDKKEYKSAHYLLNVSPEFDNKGKLFFTIIELPKFSRWAKEMGIYPEDRPERGFERTQSA